MQEIFRKIFRFCTITSIEVTQVLMKLYVIRMHFNIFLLFYKHVDFATLFTFLLTYQFDLKKCLYIVSYINSRCIFDESNMRKPLRRAFNKRNSRLFVLAVSHVDCAGAETYISDIYHCRIMKQQLFSQN